MIMYWKDELNGTVYRIWNENEAPRGINEVWLVSATCWQGCRDLLLFTLSGSYRSQNGTDRIIVVGSKHHPPDRRGRVHARRLLHQNWPWWQTGTSTSDRSCAALRTPSACVRFASVRSECSSFPVQTPDLVRSKPANMYGYWRLPLSSTHNNIAIF